MPLPCDSKDLPLRHRRQAGWRPTVAGLQQPGLFADGWRRPIAFTELVTYQIGRDAGWRPQGLKLTTMLNAQNRKRSSIRKIVAVAMLCLFVLRGVTFIGMAAAMAATDAGHPASAHAVLGDPCAQQDESDGPRKHAHSEHCVICCSAARDTVASHALIFVEGVLLTPDEPSTQTPRDNETSHLGKAPGLIANWSATSPPCARGI